MGCVSTNVFSCAIFGSPSYDGTNSVGGVCDLRAYSSGLPVVGVIKNILYIHPRLMVLVVVCVFWWRCLLEDLQRAKMEAARQD